MDFPQPFGAVDLLRVLARHIGRENGIHGTHLVRSLIAAHPRDGYSERLLRRLVVELRMEGHHICGRPGDGYYLARNESELNDTCLFLYERAMTGLTQISRMKRISLPDLRGQLRLPD